MTSASDTIKHAGTPLSHSDAASYRAAAFMLLALTPMRACSPRCHICDGQPLGKGRIFARHDAPMLPHPLARTELRAGTIQDGAFDYGSPISRALDTYRINIGLFQSR